MTAKGKTGACTIFDILPSWGAAVLRPYMDHGNRMATVGVRGSK